MSAESEFDCRFDHLVLCTNELASGARWFEEKSGVLMDKGGSHPLMSTHNRLSALSDNSFMEIIAIDPKAPAIPQARWFDLDSPGFQQYLKQAPALATWVVATDNLEAALNAAREAGIDAGESVASTRGELHWNIAVRADGTLACGGAFPILIQWPTGINPVNSMQDQGLQLKSLSVQHPESDKLLNALMAIGAEHLVEVNEGPVLLRAQMSCEDRSFDLRS